MIVETVRDILLEDPDVVGFVGQRIYPVQLPDATTFPALVIAKAAGPGQYDLQGDIGLEEARIQIDCYSAEGVANCIAIKKAVRKVLSGFSGGPRSGSPCAIQGSFCITDTDQTDPATERAGPRLRRRMLEFRIVNTEV